MADSRNDAAMRFAVLMRKADVCLIFVVRNLKNRLEETVPAFVEVIQNCCFTQQLGNFAFRHVAFDSHCLYSLFANERNSNLSNGLEIVICTEPSQSNIELTTLAIDTMPANQARTQKACRLEHLCSLMCRSEHNSRRLSTC